MILRYGNYPFPIGTAGFTVTRQTLFTPRQEPYGIQETWNLSGWVLNPGGNPDTMTRKLRELEAAFSADGLDLALLTAGGKPTAHMLTSAGLLEPVRVTQPLSYPDGGGAEYVTKRTFTVSLTGVRRHAAGSSIIVIFAESLQLSGGGPIDGHIETLTGRPVKQRLRQSSLYRATQTGRAIGLYSRLGVPGPIFPQALVRTPVITFESPEKRGGTFINWPTAWEYQFESATPLVGAPHVF